MLVESVRRSITTSSLNVVLGILLAQQQLYSKKYRLLKLDHNLKLPLNLIIILPVTPNPKIES